MAAVDANVSDAGTYDDEEYLDPTIYPSVGIAAPDPGVNWAGIGDFIQEITPTALAVTGAATGKPINTSVSSGPGGFAVSTTSTSAGLAAAPLSAGTVSPITLVLLLGAGLLLVMAAVK